MKALYFEHDMAVEMRVDRPCINLRHDGFLQEILEGRMLGKPTRESG